MSRFTRSIFTTRRSGTLTAGAVLTISALALAGCSATEPADDDGTIAVVASTSVYGNLVSTLGGDAVSVTSLIESAAQDPHSYEASARDQLAVSKADLVVLNGGGYDPFAEALYESSGASAILVNAVDDDHNHIEGFNEHVWYSFHAMEHIAEQISEQLRALSPEDSAAFDAALSAFLGDLNGLEERAEEIATTADGRGVVVTEPVAVYLLEEVGLHNETPAAFTEAIEEGSDVPPTALRDVLELIESGHAALLAYNDQTSSPETERVRLAAVEAGLPVVSFTETLPEGSDYVEWMSSNLEALAVALG